MCTDLAKCGNKEKGEAHRYDCERNRSMSRPTAPVFNKCDPMWRLVDTRLRNSPIAAAVRCVACPSSALMFSTIFCRCVMPFLCAPFETLRGSCSTARMLGARLALEATEGAMLRCLGSSTTDSGQSLKASLVQTSNANGVFLGVGSYVVRDNGDSGASTHHNDNY